jgi:tetratricopeptide (TPR) repeat protein
MGSLHTASQAAIRPPFDPGADAAIDWLEAACLGGVLSPGVQWELNAAAAAYRDDDVAEAHLQRAFLLAPEHPAVHIGLYRFYFYKNRLSEALAVAERCLQKAARDNAIALDWRAVRPLHADFSTYAALPRFYLFTLKACAYLHLRLGRIDTGEAMVDKLMELDAADRLGGSVLRGVIARIGHEDDDYL